MNIAKHFISGIAALSLWVLAGCSATGGGAVPGRAADSTRAAATSEGLVQRDVPGLQEVYVRPGASLAKYDSVMLEPIEVSFRKDWTPQSAGRPIDSAAQQSIREGLARILREEFTRELTEGGKYRVVETAGPGVLRVTAEIRDLYVNAPDTATAPSTRTYAMSAGELTLVAELRDAASGELFARVLDHRRDPESPWLELNTQIDNVAAARRVAASWATVLRRQLDAAREPDAKGAGGSR